MEVTKHLLHVRTRARSSAVLNRRPLPLLLCLGLSKQVALRPSHFLTGVSDRAVDRDETDRHVEVEEARITNSKFDKSYERARKDIRGGGLLGSV